MHQRSSLFLSIAAVMLLALPVGVHAATPADDGLVHVGDATTLSFRDMVRPAYWVVHHHHRVWVPGHHHR